MKDWRPYVVAGLAATLAWLAGLSYVTLALVALSAAAGMLVMTRLEARPDPRFERRKYDRRHGARGELQELAWSMVTRDGRVTLRMSRRVREVGATRLARHGVRLDDPADAEAITALVGAKAFRTLTRTGSPHPTLSEVRHAVEALDRIGTTRKTGDT